MLLYCFLETQPENITVSINSDKKEYLIANNLNVSLILLTIK